MFSFLLIYVYFINELTLTTPIMKIQLLFLLFFLSINSYAQILDDVWELDELNVSTETDSYPYLTNDGLRLYFTNNANGTNNLYFTSRPDLNTDFEPKQLLDNSVFSGLTACWLTEDELTVYFSSGSDLFRSERATLSSPFSPSVQITLSGPMNTFIGSVTLTPSEDELYLYTVTNLSRYTFTAANTYTFDSNVDIPLGFEPGGAQLSKDGLELYWTLIPAGTDSSYLFKADRASLGDDFVSPVKMNSFLNSSSLNNSQASYASLSNVLVWVRNDNSLWDGNDLYIAQSGSTGIDELENSQKELVKIVDFMGREIPFKTNTPMIYIYSDGSTERIFTPE